MTATVTAPVAAPAAEPAKTPETPAAPDPKEGQMLAQLRAREAAFVQKQQADARARAEFENYKKQSQAEIDRVRQQADMAKADPLRYLKEHHNWTDDALAARILSGGKPTAIEEQEALKRELGELKAWKQGLAEQEQRAKQQSAQEAALETFAKAAKAGSDKWPLASRAKEARLKARGMEIAIEHARQGVTLTDEEVLDKLEEELSELVPKAKPDTESAATTTPGKETAGQDTQPAPTLTNRGAAATAEVPKVDMLKMSESDRTAYVLAELKRMRAAGLIID